MQIQDKASLGVTPPDETVKPPETVVTPSNQDVQHDVVDKAVDEDTDFFGSFMQDDDEEQSSKPTVKQPVVSKTPFDVSTACTSAIAPRQQGEVKNAVAKFDWTDGDASAAESKAGLAWKAEFETVFATNCTDQSTEKYGTKSATTAARTAAIAAIEPDAVALAKVRAKTAQIAGTAFADSIDVASKTAMTGYGDGSVGAKAKFYSTALNGKTSKEILQLLDSDTDAIPVKNSTAGKDQFCYSFKDNSLVRVKPDGDAFKDGAMFCCEVTKAGSGGGGQDDVAFKIDDAARPVPKGPSDVKNPYDAQKQASQAAAFALVLIEAGHRDAS